MSFYVPDVVPLVRKVLRIMALVEDIYFRICKSTEEAYLPVVADGASSRLFCRAQKIKKNTLKKQKYVIIRIPVLGLSARQPVMKSGLRSMIVEPRLHLQISADRMLRWSIELSTSLYTLGTPEAPQEVQCA